MLAVRILLLGLLLGPAWAAETWFAPDFRWDENLESHLGLVNTQRARLEVTLTGYPVDGGDPVVVMRSLPPYQKLEESAVSLFPDVAIAWLAVASEGKEMLAYARFEVPGGGGREIVPLNALDGGEAWAPLVWSEDGLPILETRLAATTDAETEIVFEPYRDPRFLGSIRRAIEPRDAMLTGGEQAAFVYEQLYERWPYDILWDKITSSAPIAGIQHLGTPGGPLASYPLPRTPYRELAVSHLGGKGSTSRVVLVNTNPDPLDVEVAVFDAHGFIYPELIVLEPREKRVIDLDDRETLPLPHNTAWIRFRAHEYGLLAVQLTETEDGWSASDPSARFGTNVYLPHLPDDAARETSVTLINPDPEPARVLVYGLDGIGGLTARLDLFLDPYERRVTGMEDLFGDEAGNVGWMRLYCLNRRIGAWATTTPRDGGDFSTMTGIVGMTARVPYQVSDFEYIRIKDMIGQGWRFLDYNDETYRNWVSDEMRHRFADGHSKPYTGQFFTETAHFPAEQQHFLAYEPLSFTKRIFPDKIDRILFLSPFFEVPPMATYHLSFDMRFFDPQNATPTSRYGLAWRLEGEETWQWFGLGGELIVVDPPLLIADCWEDVAYSTLDRIVTKSNWWTFENQLPADIRGKRMQVAFFYDHIHTPTSPMQGPMLQIDNIQLNAEPHHFALFYEKYGSGDFVFVND